MKIKMSNFNLASYFPYVKFVLNYINDCRCLARGVREYMVLKSELYKIPVSGEIELLSLLRYCYGAVLDRIRTINQTWPESKTRIRLTFFFLIRWPLSVFFYIRIYRYVSKYI